MESKLGGLSIAVPLELKGLEMMSAEFGKLPWKELVMPVIPLARDGFDASPLFVRHLSHGFAGDQFTMLPHVIRKTFFIEDNGVWRVPNVGERCCQRPALAKTLERMAEEGVQQVYSSDWGDDLVADIHGFAYPGIIKKADLRSAKPVMKEAIKARVFGMDFYTMPPPSSGAVLLMALKFLETYDNHTDDALSAHRMVQAMRHMFAVRSHMGDPGINNKFLDLDKFLKDILKDSFIQKLRKGTSDESVQDESFYGGKYGLKTENVVDSGTSHICTADAEGNAVTLTTTINRAYGSLVYSEKTGLLLNDEMDDFAKPGIIKGNTVSDDILLTTSLNLIHPGRKPVSSMSPVIATKDGKLHLAMGASGGALILTSLLQTIYQNQARGIDLAEAIQQGRISDTLHGAVLYEIVERGAVTFEPDSEMKEALTEKGHTLTPFTSYFSNVQALELTDDGMFRGVPDPRKDGAAASNL